MYNSHSFDSSHDHDHSLEYKANTIEQDLLRNHLTEDDLLKYRVYMPSDTSEVTQIDFGDTILFTSMYLSCLSFKYSITKDDDTKKQLEKEITALHKAMEITGKQGLLARYYGKEITPELAKISNHKGLNHGIGNFKDYVWYGNTSKDQYIFFIHSLTLAYDLVDNEGLRALIRNDITSLADHLLKNGRLIDIDGSTARYSELSRKFPLNKLSLLQSAYHVSGNEKYKKELKKEFNFVDNFNWPLYFYRLSLKQYNDVLAVISYHNLIRLEQDPERRSFFLKDFRRCWRNKLRGSGNPLFDVMHEAIDSRSDHKARNELILCLEDFPLEKREHTIKIDVPSKSRFALIRMRFEKQAKEPVPIRLRPQVDSLWKKSSFSINFKGDGNIKNSGVDFLFVYWMARYYNLIREDM